VTPWLLVRRTWAVPLVLAAYALVLWAVHGRAAAVPSIVGDSATVDLANFAPLLVSLSIPALLDLGLPTAEVTAVRPIAWADRGLVLATAATVLLLGSLLAHADHLGIALAAGRNVLTLLGVALLARRWYGFAAATGAAAGCLFVTVFTGLHGPQRPYFWAVLLQPAGSWPSWAVAVTALAAGVWAVGAGRP
jgi:hypothetical protein